MQGGLSALTSFFVPSSPQSGVVSKSGRVRRARRAFATVVPACYLNSGLKLGWPPTEYAVGGY